MGKLKRGSSGHLIFSVIQFSWHELRYRGAEEFIYLYDLLAAFSRLSCCAPVRPAISGFVSNTMQRMRHTISFWAYVSLTSCAVTFTLKNSTCPNLSRSARSGSSSPRQRTRTCIACLLGARPRFATFRAYAPGPDLFARPSKPSGARFQRETQAESLLPGRIFRPP